MAIKTESELDQAYQVLATRFAAAGKFLTEVGDPDSTRNLMDALVSGDARRFQSLTDRLELPILGKCAWTRSLVEHIVCSFAGWAVECRLREDLSTQQRIQYFQIALRHQVLRHGVASGGSPTVDVIALDGNAAIPPGPFLDELMASDLVACKRAAKYDCRVALALSQPELVCV